MKKEFEFIVFLLATMINWEFVKAEDKNSSTSIKIVSLTFDSFDEQVKKVPHFVMFHNPRYLDAA